MMYDRDWAGANREFDHAIELDPGDANAGNFYSVYLSAVGRHEESIAEAKRAQRLDPLTPFTNIILATRFYYARQFDESIYQIKGILEMEHNFGMAYYYLAWPYAQKGMFSEAMENITKAMERLGKTTPILSCLGIVHSLLGNKNEANNVLHELITLSKQKCISTYFIAQVYLGLDQKDQAFEWLEKGYEEHDPLMIYLKVDPLLDGLRQDPRLTTLLKQMGLSTGEPDYQQLANEVMVPHEKSMVVLPFENNSPDKADEYFSDGLTEEIITDLSKIHSLRVISRSSAMRLKGTSKDVKTIGRELNVRYVLEGSVRKAKDNLRITAELVDTETDLQLWAEKYYGTMADVFDIQEKVSRAIAGALKLKLTSKETRQIAERPIENLQAYECYLKARQEMYRGTKETMDRTFQLIQNGLDLVGPNELLYASLGYANYWYFRYIDKVHESYLVKAEECAKKVFELNPNSAHGHAITGLIHLTRGNLQEVARSMKRALDIDPSNADALTGLAASYCWSGQIEAGASVATTLLEIDPLTPFNYMIRGGADCLDGRFEQGLGFVEKAYRMDTNSPVMQWQLASVYAWCGRNQEAFTLIDRLADSAPGWPITQQVLFLKYALQGDKQRALQYASKELEIEAQHDHHFAIHLAECYALIDEKEKALDFMEHSIKGFFPPRFLLNDRLLENIRGTDRFRKLMEEVKRKSEAFEV